MRASVMQFPDARAPGAGCHATGMAARCLGFQITPAMQGEAKTLVCAVAQGLADIAPEHRPAAWEEVEKVYIAGLRKRWPEMSEQVIRHNALRFLYDVVWRVLLIEVFRLERETEGQA